MIRAGLVLLISLTTAATVFAQAKPKPTSNAPQRNIEIGGYATLGLMTFTAADTFETALGSASGSIFGGGVRVGLPLGGLFVDLGAWRFRDSGQRVFVFEGEAFPLGIPVDVTITPIELGGGWQFRFRRAPRWRPYAAGGFTSYKYSETSEFATASENVDERFNGYHLAGGLEVRVHRWIGVGGEINWTRVPDAIGDSGLSAEFQESDLGGTGFRFKLTIGR
jgi:hypothetical protein